MHIQTSYFGRIGSKNFKGRGLNAVSIARGNRYWSGPTYAPLMPSWELIKGDYSQEEYEELYREQVLSKLDPMDVLDELGHDVILLCHEKYDDIVAGKTFCHRHIVARWLEEELWLNYGMDIDVNELLDTKSDLKKELKEMTADANSEGQIEMEL